MDRNVRLRNPGAGKIPHKLESGGCSTQYMVNQTDEDEIVHDIMLSPLNTDFDDFSEAGVTESSPLEQSCLHGIKMPESGAGGKEREKHVANIKD
eukprot:10054182-Ditylum_brightwellii.AAC.1